MTGTVKTGLQYISSMLLTLVCIRLLHLISVQILHHLTASD